MIELAFCDFHDRQYEENLFCLYVIKNGLGDVLYVGISTANIWERWFGWGGHMLWDGNVIYGQSPIGIKIENHLPDSLKWGSQIWTLKDCLDFCKSNLSENTSMLTIHDIEPIMIQRLSPALNTTYNLHPGKDTTPKSKKELESERFLDEMYKKIFDKNT